MDHNKGCSAVMTASLIFIFFGLPALYRATFLSRGPIESVAMGGLAVLTAALCWWLMRRGAREAGWMIKGKPVPVPAPA